VNELGAGADKFGKNISRVFAGDLPVEAAGSIYHIWA
jgi:hypothetical protein